MIQQLLTQEGESPGWKKGCKSPRLASFDPPPPAMPPIPKVPFLNFRTVSPVDNQVENCLHEATTKAKVDISEALSLSKLKGPSPSISEVVILLEDCHNVQTTQESLKADCQQDTSYQHQTVHPMLLASKGRGRTWVSQFSGMPPMMPILVDLKDKPSKC